MKNQLKKVHPAGKKAAESTNTKKATKSSVTAKKATTTKKSTATTAAPKKRVVTRHHEWELEKQTEGLTPSLARASKKIGQWLEGEAESNKTASKKAASKK